MLQKIGAVYLIIAAQLIGVVTSVVIAFVSQSNNPYQFGFYRFIIGFLLFLPVLPHLRQLSRKTYIASFLYAADILFFIVALSLTKIALVTAIVAAGPLIAVFLEKKRSNTKLLLTGKVTIFLVLLGVMFTTTPVLVDYVTTLGSSNNDSSSFYGIIFALLAGFTSALSIVLFKEESSENPWARTLSINIAGVILGMPLLIIMPLNFNYELITGATIAAIGGGGVAIVLTLLALRSLPGSIAMALSSVSIPLSAIFGLLFLNQDLTLYLSLGVFCITVAVILSSLKPAA